MHWTLSRGPPEARKSSLSWEAGAASAFPPAYRATSLAGKNLEGEEISFFLFFFFLTGINHIHCTLLLQTDKQTRLSAEGQELGQSNATFP